MKPRKLSTLRQAILVIAIAVAVSPPTLTAGIQLPPPPPSGAACTTPDPFTSLGGGTCCNGGWLPPGMACGAPPPPPPSGAACTTSDPFTSLGGGTCCNGGWLPPGMACGVPASLAPPPDRSLAGVWLVQITPRNCATGDPIPTAAFEAIFTFHEDKTMFVSLRNNTLTVERTASHGLWRRDPGWSDYSFKFVHIRRNVATGTFAGLQESAGNLVLAQSGDEFTTDASTTVFDVNGNPVGTGGCSNSVGTRFKFEP